MSLDPTGRAANAGPPWRAALNAFEITFERRLGAGRK